MKKKYSKQELYKQIEVQKEVHSGLGAMFNPFGSFLSIARNFRNWSRQIPQKYPDSYAYVSDSLDISPNVINNLRNIEEEVSLIDINFTILAQKELEKNINFDEEISPNELGDKISKLLTSISYKDKLFLEWAKDAEERFARAYATFRSFGDVVRIVEPNKFTEYDFYLYYNTIGFALYHILNLKEIDDQISENQKSC